MPINPVELLNMFIESLAQLIPQVLAAIVVLIVGYLTGRLVNRAVLGAAKLAKFDDGFRASEIGRRLSDAGYPLSKILSLLTRVTIYALSILTALTMLQVPLIQEVTTTIASYIPRFVGAIIVFLLGAMLVEWITNLTENLFEDFTIPSRALDFLLSGVRAFMYIAVLFVTFEIGDIAPHTISVIAQALFGALMFSIGLALALLVGLGLKDSATVLLFNEPRDLYPGMMIEVDGTRGRVKRVTTLLVELEDEDGVTVLPKRRLLEKGYKVITETEARSETSSPSSEPTRK